MKTNNIAIGGISLLVLLVLRFASTTPASDGPSTASDATTTSQATDTEATSSPSTLNAAVEPPPAGLKEVHIIGMRYTDYFTDGSTTVTYRRDPATDPNFDKPDAIRTPEGMTWVHTTGGWLYDTPSGDLELGDYAVQLDGTYIENAPPFVSSTSTPAQITTSTPDGAPQDASSTAPATSTATTTDADSPDQTSGTDITATTTP
jgi:hypothetical protein